MLLPVGQFSAHRLHVEVGGRLGGRRLQALLANQPETDVIPTAAQREVPGILDGHLLYPLFQGDAPLLVLRERGPLLLVGRSVASAHSGSILAAGVEIFLVVDDVDLVRLDGRLALAQRQGLGDHVQHSAAHPRSERSLGAQRVGLDEEAHVDGPRGLVLQREGCRREQSAGRIGQAVQHQAEAHLHLRLATPTSRAPPHRGCSLLQAHLEDVHQRCRVAGKLVQACDQRFGLLPLPRRAR
mmetsp:Transcript_18093/g.68602  ORF Transcript_18093/g.68602 Transcript_18093/m.68602 type:complete len:241 (+) Transcript_18093:1586-2308(+)